MTCKIYPQLMAFQPIMGIQLHYTGPGKTCKQSLVIPLAYRLTNSKLELQQPLRVLKAYHALKPNNLRFRKPRSSGGNSTSGVDYMRNSSNVKRSSNTRTYRTYSKPSKDLRLSIIRKPTVLRTGVTWSPSDVLSRSALDSLLTIMT